MSLPGRATSAALICLLVLGSLGTGCGTTDQTSPGPVQRVLVISLPGVTWRDVRSAKLPHLRSLLRTSAVGDVSTRIGRVPASSTAAYLTIGAGTRSVVPSVDTGVALNPDESLGGIPGEDLLRRRLGKPAPGIAYIPVGATADANADSAFGAETGALGDALADSGVHRAVIANADAAEGFPTDQPPPGGAYSRSAATALMGSDGVVPDGSVGRGLLVDDPSAPFGRRLDPGAVLDSFDRAWRRPGRSVVLVEASDLTRAAGYGSRSDPTQARRLRARALAEADELIGRLLADVRDGTDAVLVVAPVARSTMGIVSLRAPGVSRGLLRSASTRRNGYVYLADIMPTLLHLVGVEPLGGIEGQPFEAAPSTGDRIAFLDDQEAGAMARAERLPWVVPAIIAALVVLAAATVLRDRLRPSRRRLIRPVAIGALGLVPGTYLAAAVPPARTSDAWFLGVAIGTGVVVGLVGGFAERWRPGIGALVGVGSILGLLALDLALGGQLQVNTVFGYSMAVAGRFTGFGNLAFALFSSAAVCAAVLIHDRHGDRSMPWIAGVLVAAVVFDGLPMLGADVGGVLSIVPAFAVTVLALRGRRIGLRELVLAIGAGVVVVGLLGLLDSSRPAGSQTHLARIGGDLTSGRVSSVATIVWRRAHASFGGNATIVWLFALTLVVVALVQAYAVAIGKAGPGAPARQRTVGGTALLAGLGLVAALGLVANDSSIAVPATMLIVISPVVILRITDPALADHSTSGGLRS